MRTLARPLVRTSVRALALASGLTALASAAHAQVDALPPGQIDLQLSVEQSIGRYREASATRIRTTVLTGRYRRGPWLAELQWPWVRVNSTDTGGLPDTAAVAHGSPAPSASRSEAHGPGDALLKLGVSLREMDVARTGLDLVLKLKARNGSHDDGLGTGGRDVALQLEATRPVGHATVFGHLGHRRTGDVPGARPYRNPWYGELGAAWPTDAGGEVGAFIDVREPLGRLGSLGEATAYSAWRDGPRRLQLHLSRGLRPASADWAAGLSLRWRF